MSFIQKFIADFGLQDSRFWEVFDEKGNSQGIHMYGDLITLYTHNGILSNAYEYLHSKGWNAIIIGDLYPLEEDSLIPEIQAKKVKIRARERKKERKKAKSKGFKLNSNINFGKYKGIKTIQQIIDNDISYWNWLQLNVKMLLHPEINEYLTNKN